MGVARSVAVLDPGECLIKSAGTEIEAEVGLDAAFLSLAQHVEPLHELVGAELVALNTEPSQLGPLGSILTRPDAILPVVRRHKVASRIPDHGDVELTQGGEDVLPETVLVGERTPGLINASVDATAHVSKVVSQPASQLCDELHCVFLLSKPSICHGINLRQTLCGIYLDERGFVPDDFCEGRHFSLRG